MKFRKSLAAAVGAAALLGAAGAGDADARSFNASIWFPDTHPLVDYGYLQWAEKLEEASGGELQANVFTGTALLPAAGHLSGLRDGITDMGYHAGTYTPAELPVDNLLAQLAMNYDDYFVAAFAITEMNMKDPAALAQWEENEVVYLGGYATPPYIPMCNSPIQSVADFEGKRIRMPGAVHSDFAHFVGAVPVDVPSDEMYSGLDRGGLDCAVNAANDLRTRSLWDVTTDVTTLGLGVYWAGYQYGANADFWASLSPENRRVMLDTIAEAMVETGQGYLASADAALEEAGEHGVSVHEPTEELEATLEEFLTEARDNAIRRGQEDFGLEDSEAILERFEAVAAKWEDLLADVDRDDTERLVELFKTEVYDQIDVETYGIY